MITAVLVHNPFVWYSPETWLYALIRKFSGSKWNHAVLWFTIEGQDLVCDANFHGVVIKNRKGLYSNLKREIAVLDIPTTQHESVLYSRIFEAVGTKYDFGVYGRYITKKNKNNKRLYCFELLGRIFTEQFDSSKFLTGKDFEKYIKYYIKY